MLASVEAMESSTQFIQDGVDELKELLREGVSLLVYLCCVH